MPESEHAHLDQLLSRLVEETISQDDLVVLETLLDGDVDAQERYLHYLELHKDLKDAVGNQKGLLNREGNMIALKDRRRLSVPGWIGAVAAVVLLGLALFHLWTASGEPEKMILTIADCNGVLEWTGQGGKTDRSLSAGDALSGGTLEVTAANSWAELVFSDGTKVWTSGPSIVTFSEGAEGKRIHLRQGELSLDVTPQLSGYPLLLQTPSAEAKVLGTQFNVTANNVATRLAVHEGLVQVTRLVDQKTQDVPADHHIVAALERRTSFVALPRGEPVTSWECDLRYDVRQGYWRPGAEWRLGSLDAETHLFRGDFGKRRNPILLHSVVVSPSAPNRTPVLLTEGARLRVRGRLDRSCNVALGFGTRRARGVLSGKYNLSRYIEVGEGVEGRFEVELDLGDIPRMKTRFPASTIGQELGWIWIQTVREDAGLEVTSVELIDRHGD